jgi:hypothetical protein
MNSDANVCGKMRECGYHAGGGSKDLPCAESQGHSEDAPVQKWHMSGSKVQVIVPGTGTWTNAIVESCDGTCDDRRVSVRLARRGARVRLTVSGLCVR